MRRMDLCVSKVLEIAFLSTEVEGDVKTNLVENFPVPLF
jgi:hypothetical protein